MVIVPLFFKALKDPSALDANTTWQPELESLGKTAKQAKPESLLGLHMATHWQRMVWVAPDSPLVAAMRAALGDFLDQAAALPAIVSTAPDREKTTRMLLERFGRKAA